MVAPFGEIGMGLIVLATFWIICISACWILSRHGKRFASVIPLILGACLTLALLMIRRDGYELQVPATTDTDERFIPRLVLLSFVGVCFLGGFGIFTYQNYHNPQRAYQIKASRRQ